MVGYPSLRALVGFIAYTAVVSATDGPSDSIGVGVHFHVPRSSGGALTLLSARQKGDDADMCYPGQVTCDKSCIDKSFACCHVGQGQACELGYTCYSQGCCPLGKTCSGPPKGCTATTKMCDIGCIPKDRVCCGYGDGSSCEGDTVCLSSGMCGRQKSDSGGGSSGDGELTPDSTFMTPPAQTPGSTPRPSLTTKSESSIGAVISDTVIVGSGSYSLSLITNSDGQSQTPSPTTEESSSETETSRSATSTSSATAGSTPTGGDKGAAGTALKAPAVLAGLLAIAAYVI